MGELRKPSVKSDSTKKEKKIKSMPKSVLEAFENIVDLAKDSNLDAKFLKKAAPQISFASKKLGLTDIQTVLLALCVDKSESNRILISEIAEYR